MSYLRDSSFPGIILPGPLELCHQACFRQNPFRPLSPEWARCRRPSGGDPARKSKLNFPEWRVIREYALAIQEAPLSKGEKLLCLQALAHAFPLYFLRMGRDVIIAIEHLALGAPSTT